MEKLYLYGWKNYHANTQHTLLTSDATKTGRVISIKGNIFVIATEKGHLQAELLGRILFTFEKWEQPKVGDWVTFIDYDDNALIEDVLPRYNHLYRKTAGREVGKQVIAANVDQAIIIQGMDHDFNLKRLERYIVQAIICNIAPVVLLNKQDLVDDISQYIREIERLQRNLQLFTCSIKTGEGLEAIQQEIFIPGSTSVLIGSSGVGKSSLLNALGHNSQKTSTVSESTGKGRHTTTTRDLFLLENGAIVIDTPGMREFGLGFEEDANFADQFPVISQFAGGCKFKDCSHVHEKGCNVIEAVENGEIDPLVYESYLKLLKEQKHFQTTIHEQKKQGKQMGKMVREAKEYRKKYKF